MVALEPILLNRTDDPDELDDLGCDLGSRGIQQEMRDRLIGTLAGATEYQLMAVMGWTNPAQAMKYIEAARRRKMATGAYDLLETEQNND